MKIFPVGKIIIKNLSISNAYYLLILYMSSHTSEFDRIKTILDKLTKKEELIPPDIVFLSSPSSNEEIQAMKKILRNEILPTSEIKNAADILLLLKQSKTLGGKRKRTQSKKSNKNKKRKSYRKH